MATAPQAQRVTVRFSGGYVVAPRATIQRLLGSIEPVWTSGGGLLPSGRKRKYGSRQRSNAAAGEPMKIRLRNGEEWTVRLVGNHVDFIDRILANLGPTEVDEIVSQRGTIYGREFVES